MIRKRLLIYGLLISIISISQINEARCQSPLFDILGEQDKIIIPFEYKFNFIIVDLKLNGKIPLKFIFDTGATHTILFEKLYAELLGLPCKDSIKILGADLSSQLNAHICRKVELHFKNNVSAIRDIIVLERDQLFLKNFLGMNLDGVIGANLFRNFVVKIDYQNRQIEISNPETFKAPKKGYKKLNISFINNKPYIEVPIEISKDSIVNAKLLMDSGAGINMILYNKSHPKINLPQNHIMGSLGAGMGGVIEGYRARVHNIELAEFDFIQPIIHFQNIDSSYFFIQNELNNVHGLIGNILLSQFTIIIDWWNKCIYLKERRLANHRFKYDKSGIYLYAVGENLNEYIIQQVVINSPSYKAGLQSGDIIKTINYWPTHLLDLEEITRRFQRREGRKIRLKITRDGVDMIKCFKLKELI